MVVMVMIFEGEKARNFLLRNGAVYTFRVKRRKKVGKDWITDRRGGRKIAEVLIEEVGEFAPTGLTPYVGLSGFNSLEEWTAEIRRLNDGKLPEKGWLYMVVLR